eukprot:m.195363 g.195363  ORF g.195363 m.195363 type:complete len:522 (-) comp32565_c0_seq1:170-1735(-)
MFKVVSTLVLGVFVATTSARTHYGDPNTIFGCLPDEVKATITGLAGDLCIPPCAPNGTCPQDKPVGASSMPGCVLTSSTGDKYCALVCTPADEDAQCGQHASCKQGPKDGLCTFDDIPKPPSSEHWVPVTSPTFKEQSVCLAVGFTPDGKVGYAGGGTSNSGAQIIKSVDSGATWTVEPAKQELNIFLDAVAASATNAVVTGVIEQEHTIDGVNFIGGGPFLCPAQDIGILPDSKEFALVGECAGKGNGIYLSRRGAVYTAKQIPTSVLNMTYQLVRYGAFPSETTWYVAAGTFPSSNNNDKNGMNTTHKRVTHRVTASSKDYTFEQLRGEDDPAPVDCSVDPTNCFAGAIVKTTDGGNTWTKVWENVNTGDNIYNNGISCSSVDHCVAVVEGDSSRILVTRDGGKTWKETQNDQDKSSSLVAVKMLDENEVWVSGGELSNMFAGRFWHSLDGGDTWTLEAIKGLYIFSFDLVTRESGYAVALTQASGVELLKYRDTNATQQQPVKTVTNDDVLQLKFSLD